MRRILSALDVAEKLRSHERWLLYRGWAFPFEAKDADIAEDADLQGKDLSGALLQGARFTRVNLTGTKFVGAECNADTKFLDAILRDADLTDCTGLNAAALAGTDVTGAKIPESIAGFETLKTVQDSSSQAKTLFISMLAACAYTWLTVGTTKDAGLLTDSTTSPLPIIATPIPIASFYFIAPILLVLLSRTSTSLCSASGIYSPTFRPSSPTASPSTNGRIPGS